MRNLTGKLLVVVPRELGEIPEDDLFDRCVVLLLDHSDDGAHGIMLNRESGAPIEAALPDWQDHVVGEGVFYQGGPVGKDSALGLVSMPGDVESVGLKRLFGGIGLVDLDAPPQVVMPEVAALRIFAGYCGWSAGQLEQEIRDGGWFVLDCEAADPFSTDPDTLWEQVLRRQGGVLSWATLFPDDPSMN